MTVGVALDARPGRGLGKFSAPRILLLAGPSGSAGALVPAVFVCLSNCVALFRTGREGPALGGEAGCLADVPARDPAPETGVAAALVDPTDMAVRGSSEASLVLLGPTRSRGVMQGGLVTPPAPLPDG